MLFWSLFMHGQVAIAIASSTKLVDGVVLLTCTALVFIAKKD
jgi:hypothetical protein